MADRFTEVRHNSFLDNVMGSFVGALIGFLLFVLSFPVLWWNQGRINLGTVAEDSLAVTTVQPANDGKLVAAAGALETKELLGDPPYLKPGRYVQLSRQPEMYAWVEKEESETRKNVGGSSDTVTTYDYEKEWTSSPEASSDFRHPAGHSNPEMRVKAETRTVNTATVGPFSFSPADCSLPGGEQLALTDEILGAAVVREGAAPAGGAAAAAADDEAAAAAGTAAPAADSSRPRLLDGYLYLGRGNPSNPQVGDVRIRYQALAPGGQVTLFGKQAGSKIESYRYKDKVNLFRVFESNREDAIAQLKLEHKIMGYVIGAAGFLMMWMGMGMVFGPLMAFADILPFVGNLGRSAIGCATFPIALVLTFVVVMISKVFHSPIIMIGIGIIFAGALFWFVRNRVAAAKAREGV